MLIASALAAVVIIALIALPAIGAAAIVAYAVFLIAVPYWWTRHSLVRAAAKAGAPSGPNIAGQSMARAGSVIAGLVRVRYPVLAVIAVVTAFAVLGAMDVGSKTEPSDFFPSDSDLITSINRITDHSSSVSPGNVLIYAEGSDLADPRALRAAAATVESVGREGGDLFVQNPDGSFAAPKSALDLARAAVSVEYARATISSDSGVSITDADRDGFPDTPEQVDAVFSYVVESGIPADSSTFVYTADEARQLLAKRGDSWATVLSFPLQGFGDSALVMASRDAVEVGEADFLTSTSADGLAISTSISGSQLAEQLALDSITDAMLISVPLAMFLCVIVAGLVMRSVRFGAASVVPIVLGVVWLLAFMFVFGFNLNVITATIAVISVGVGIDYSIP